MCLVKGQWAAVVETTGKNLPAFADKDYLISLWTTCLLQWVQNFFSSRRAVVLRRFLEVVYRETPGERLAGLVLHSVHSSVMISLTPLFFAIVLTQMRGINVYRHEDLLFHICTEMGKNCWGLNTIQNA